MGEIDRIKAEYLLDWYFSCDASNDKQYVDLRGHLYMFISFFIAMLFNQKKHFENTAQEIRLFH